LSLGINQRDFAETYKVGEGAELSIPRKEWGSGVSGASRASRVLADWDNRRGIEAMRSGGDFVVGRLAAGLSLTLAQQPVAPRLRRIHGALWYMAGG